MTPGRDMVLKRTRESTSKVRTGCSTCKARRVKCDEAKPTCRRCAIGSRKCEYNTARAAIPRNLITVYLPPIQSQPVFFINDRGLDFFQQNLAAKLDGHFDSDLWNKLVLQLSHSEPSVRHAVSAISITYRDVESSLQHPAGYVIANPKARQEWNAAVKSLSARIQAFPNSNLVPLVCCLLFTCIEFLRGDIQSSMLHVQNGFKILAALPHDSYEDSNRSLNDISIIEDHLAPVFSRLAVLFSLTGRIISPTNAPRAQDESPQEDLVDSRLRLYEISHAFFAFVREVAPKAATLEIEVDDLVKQIKIQTRLDTWYSQLGDLLKRMEASGKSPKQAALGVLLVNYKVINIWVRVCTIAGESATDSYHDDFKEIVHHAEQCVKADMGDATPQPLSFDMQILAPLYYTTLKCRNPTTRRRALELLKLTPRREALWNAHYAYVTAKRVVEVEEMHLNGREWPNETSRVHHLPLPDDESRVSSPGETTFDFRKFNDGIVPSPAYPGTVKAVIQTKPWGLMGEWHTVTEYINL